MLSDRQVGARNCNYDVWISAFGILAFGAWSPFFLSIVRARLCASFVTCTCTYIYSLPGVTGCYVRVGQYIYCMVVYIFPFFSIFEGKEPGRLRSKKLNGYFIASMDMDTSGLRAYFQVNCKATRARPDKRESSGYRLNSSSEVCIARYFLPASIEKRPSP